MPETNSLEILKSMAYDFRAQARFSASELDALHYAIQKLEAPMPASMMDVNAAYLRGYNQGRKETADAR